MTTPVQFTVSNLSDDQRLAYDAITSWMRDRSKPTLTLGGYAGSGKSTVTAVVAHELLRHGGPIAFATFTGKASSVLGRKLAEQGIRTVNRVVQRTLGGGVAPFEPRPYCGTIHGLVMRPCDLCMVEEEEHEHTYGAQCEENADEELSPEEQDKQATSNPFTVSNDGPCLACNPPPPKKVSEGPCPRCNNNRFLKRDRLDRGYRLIIVDEASMVSDDMLDMLKSYRIPILGVGDHGQLKPVKGQGSLMLRPDLRLEKIHRQAEGNPIIALSKYIRENGDLDDALVDDERFTIMRAREMEAWIAKRFPSSRREIDPQPPEGILGTVMIAWTNRARVALNEQVRNALGMGEKPPSKGEVVIALKNAAPIYNGMRGVLAYDAIKAGSDKAPKWKASIDFVEDRQVAKDILMAEDQFYNEKTIDYDMAREMGVSMSALGQLYDFGYGLTCHKMQGSSAHEVGVYIEPGLSRMPKEDRTRWLYSAVTRAEKKLVVFR